MYNLGPPCGLVTIVDLQEVPKNVGKVMDEQMKESDFEFSRLGGSKDGPSHMGNI